MTTANTFNGHLRGTRRMYPNDSEIIRAIADRVNKIKPVACRMAMYPPRSCLFVLSDRVKVNIQLVWAQHNDYYYLTGLTVYLTIGGVNKQNRLHFVDIMDNLDIALHQVDAGFKGVLKDLYQQHVDAAKNALANLRNNSSDEMSYDLSELQSAIAEIGKAKKLLKQKFGV